MRNYELKDYNKVLKLRKKGLGSLRISRILNIPRTTIDTWIYRGMKPYYHSEKRILAHNSKENIDRMRAMNKITQPNAVKAATKINTKKLPKSAFKSSKELGYILGVISGDGHVSVKGRRVILAVTDKEFALEFKKCIEKWSGFKARLITRKLKTDKFIKFRKLQWVCYIDSIEASKFLASFNLSNITKSSNVLKCQFLKGFFDSEGYVIKHSHGVIGYNTDKKLIDIVRKLLESLNIYYTITQGITRPIRNQTIGRPIYRINIYRKENVIKYYDNIGFSIKRKQLILENHINRFKSKP